VRKETSTTEASTILIIPGLRDHVAEHWQTLLASKLTKVKTVPPLEQDKFNCIARVEAIQRVMEEIDGPIIVVAHSAGVAMFVHWARKYQRPIKGALLATPPDLDIPLPAGYPTPETLRINHWFPVPRNPLPFPSIVAASEDDHLAAYSSVAAMAKDWKSELINLGKVGHLNPASGYGEWPKAKEFIDCLEGIFEGDSEALTTKT
jgi:predicted alpha/beta hydrolase family esterase